MAFKLKDLKCNDCGHTQEVLLNSTEEEEIRCESCDSLNMESKISIGVGQGMKGNWAKWRGGLG